MKYLLTILTLSSVVLAQPSLEHTPNTYLKPELRTTLHVKIKNETPINIKRLYFKASDTKNYNFVKLTCSDTDTCKGVLPKINPTTKEINYLFLVVASDKQVYKTQTYTTAIQHYGALPDSQKEISDTKPITVLSEQETPPKEIEGFSDDILIDSIESSARFGVVAGLYTQLTATAGSSTAIGATGTTTATTTATATTASTTTAAATTATAGGMSTTAVVATTAAVVAGAGAAVALSTPEEESNSQKSYDVKLQGDSTWSASVTTKGSSCTYSENSSATRTRESLPEDGSESHSGTCNLSYENEIYRFETDDGAIYQSSTVTKDETSFEMREQGGSSVLLFTKQ